MAKSKVRGPMGVVATRLCLSRVRQQTRRQGDDGRRSAGAATHLEHQAGNRPAYAPAHLRGHEDGDRRQPLRRQSRGRRPHVRPAQGRPSANAPARPPPRPDRPGPGHRTRFERAPLHQARLGVPRPHGGTFGRSPDDDVERGRPRRPTVDGPRAAHESAEGAPRPVERPGYRHAGRGGRASRRRSRLSVRDRPADERRHRRS